jgi:hypothetical protein
MEQFECEVLDLLGSIVSCEADLARTRSMLAQLDGISAGELMTIAKRHKALTLIASKSKALQLSGPLSDAVDSLAPETASARRHYEDLDAEIRWLNGLPELTDARVALIKGFSSGRFYPSIGVRWSRDIDLFVPSWQHARFLLKELRARGYGFDEQECPWFKVWDVEDQATLYGQIFLMRPVGGGFRRVDIHFGRYSIGYSGSLAVDLTDDYMPWSDSGSLSCLGATTTILVMLGHALSDGYVSIKDANDCAAMAMAGAEVDWSRVGAEVRRHGLGPQGRLLSNYVLASYASPAVQEFGHRLFNAAGPGSTRPWRMHDRNWALRTRVNVLHTARTEVPRRPLRGVLRTVRTYAYYRPRLEISLRPRRIHERAYNALLAKSSFIPTRLRPDACPTIISKSHSALAVAELGCDVNGWLATDIEGVESQIVGGQTYLRIGDDEFVVSYDQLVRL